MFSNKSACAIWVVGVALAGCTPGPEVSVDGRRVADLQRASELAGPGSAVTLGAGDHLGGVELADGVVITGAPGARVVGDQGLLVGLGALSVAGVELVGGGPDAGGAVTTAGDLTLSDVRFDGGPGDVPFRPHGSLFVTGGSFAHDGVVVQTGTVTGRARRAELIDVELHGVAAIPADHLDVQGLFGAADLRVSGQSMLIQDSALIALEARSPAMHLAGVEVSGAASLAGGDALLSDVRGGTWSLDLLALTAAGWTADGIAGEAVDVDLADVQGTLFVLRSDRAELTRVRASELDVSASVLHAEELAGGRVALWGLGEVTSVRVEGPSPTLALGQLTASGLLVRSSTGPATVVLQGTSVNGMAVVEPPDVDDPGASLATDTYANVTHLTWLGGRRARLTPVGAPLFLAQSILAGAALGPVDDVVFDGTVLWHYDGSLVAVPNAIVDDPRFLAPGDPRLHPDSPHVGRGAFAGPYGALVEALWSSSP
jgi:hypothetical protein